MSDAALALVVAVVSALAAGWCAVKLAGAFTRAATELPLELGLEPATAKS
jgi:hypothetical protein